MRGSAKKNQVAKGLGSFVRAGLKIGALLVDRRAVSGPDGVRRHRGRVSVHASLPAGRRGQVERVWSKARGLRNLPRRLDGVGRQLGSAPQGGLSNAGVQELAG